MTKKVFFGDFEFCRPAQKYLIYLGILVVGGTGIEPVAPAV
jgi:hypothetical protein